MPYNRQKVWQTYMGDAERGECLCCGTEPITKNNFHVGHIEAKAKGGSDDMANLRPVCGWCNTRMGTKNMVIFQKEKHPNAKAIKVKRVRGAVGLTDAAATKTSKKKSLPNPNPNATTTAIVQPHQIIVMPAAPVVPVRTSAINKPQCYSLFLLIIIIIIVIIVVVIFATK